MKITNALGTFCAGALLSMGANAAPIDLNTWSQQGVAANGNWAVSADGSTVNQSINGDPTFFVSDTNYLNTEFDGSFQVGRNFDNDFIGFVFGYQSPLSSNADDPENFNMFLFDWKQGNQGRASEGFTLSYINGMVEADDDTAGAFWGKDNASASNLDSDVQLIANNFGNDLGWVDDVLYDFNLTYQSNRIRITIDGGTFNDETIFDVGPDAVAGLNSFQDGRFGFYNLSQQDVTYQGFTETVVVDPCIANPTLPGCVVTPPPPPPPTGVPEPSSIGLMLLGGAFALFRQRRRLVS